MKRNIERDDTLNELVVINNLINQICGIRETNHIMEVIIAELIKNTDADQGIISLVSPLEKNALSTVIRAQDKRSDTIPYHISDLVSGWVLKNNRILKIDDLDNDDRFSDLDSDNGKYKYIICTPMTVRGETIGLITLIRESAKKPFTDHHCRLVGILTSQSAHILTNAKLLEEQMRINRLLEVSQRKLEKENLRLKNEHKTGVEFESIISKSSKMKKVLTLVSKFSDNDAPVLITGETGTGKELIARALHHNSKRRQNQLVVINCSVKTETLLESELFGHVKGAFTGAIRDKIGLFKKADKSAIFLDEIGDAPLSTQAAILRVIQNGEVRPLGSTKTEIVDVRVLSATNKNLKEEISHDRFREDLFYRLNTFNIELPPLRDRRDDISVLINHFLEQFRIKNNRDKLSISPAALKVLLNYNWPGNIRQLENEMERASVICGLDGVISVADISNDILISTNQLSDSDNKHGRLKEIVARVESDIIRTTLIENEGNIQQTSRTLGLTRKGLKDKMTRYDIKIDYTKLLSE
ncbi:MAG: sigma-54-dependent Fis family transcriptional regulator [bacterium]|nr:sigma-54-dependent Fis family transcriptional regulator [bacterium]